MIFSFLLATLFIQPVLAGPDPNAGKVLRIECKNASILRLRFKDLPELNEELDYCRVDPTHPEVLPAAVARLVTQVMILHQKVAKTLKVSEKSLWSSPYSIEVMGSPAGVLNIASTPDEVKMGVFPDWFSKSGKRSNSVMNEAVYAHELGHLLQATGKNELMHALYSSKFMNEVLPDFIPIAVLKRSFDPGAEFPGCLQGLREIKGNETLALPFGYFSPDENPRGLFACCKELEIKHQHSKYSKPACDLFQSRKQKDDETPYDTKPFSPDQVSFLDGYSLLLEAHRFSIVLNAYLKSVPKASEWFLTQVLATESVPAKLKYACRSIKDEKNKTEVEMLSVRAFLQKLKSFDPAEWKKRSLDGAIMIADRESRDFSIRKAADQLKKEVTEVDCLERVAHD